MDFDSEALTFLGTLIGLIYEGATDPSRWTTEILPALGAFMRAPQAYLFSTLHPPQNGGYFFHYGITQEFIDLYVSKYQKEDVWAAAAIQKNQTFEGNVVLGDELVPRQQWLQSKAYQEGFANNQDMAQMIAGAVFGLESKTALPTSCSFFRGLHHPDFGEEDKARLRLVLPHLSRSLGVMQRLRSAELTMATSLAALDHLSSGVLLLRADGTVVHANTAAQRMLDAGDGLYLRKSSHGSGLGKLVAQDAAISRAISDAIGPTLSRDPYTTRHFSSSITVPRGAGFSSYSLQFSSLGDHAEFGGSSQAVNSIIFITESGKKVEIDPLTLERRYGLTPAEAKVAITLVEFSAAKEVASVLALSPHTVRTQIRQVYAKLGVDSRTRFVRLMLGLASQRP